MTADDFDVRSYTGPSRVGARHALHVASALESAMPADADANERRAVGEVVAKATAIQAKLNERDETSVARVRPVWIAFAACWSVMTEILGALARLGSLSPRSAAAQALLSRFFPEGSAFVKEDAGAAWAAGARTLDRIDAAGAAAELGSFVGPETLEAARRATVALREAAGAGPMPRETVSTTAVVQTTSELSQLIGLYCRLLAAKLDERDPRTVERFRKAVTPLDEYRASRRGGEDDDEVTPVAPATPTTPVTPAKPIAPGLPGAPALEGQR